MSILRSILNRLMLKADATVTTQTTAVIEATTTNSGIAIVPNGSGAITAQIPDGTIAGGNARGVNAVDLQMSRTANNQVAFGSNSVISGGINNRISNLNCSIIGGNSNAATEQHASVIGGINNISSGVYSTAGGSGGNITGRGATGIGENLTISGRSSAGFGGALTISNDYSGSFGNFNLVQSLYSMGFGNGTKSYLQGQLTNSGNLNFNRGNNQYSFINPSKIAQLETSSTTVLSLDGTGITNLIIPDGNTRAWNVQVNWVCLISAISGTATGISVGDVITSVDFFGFKKTSGVSSISAITTTATNLMVTSPAFYALSSIAYTVGASQELSLTFTGPTFEGGGSVTARITARVELTEIASN
jgi:hypothetical protein